MSAMRFLKCFFRLWLFLLPLINIYSDYFETDQDKEENTKLLASLSANTNLEDFLADIKKSEDKFLILTDTEDLKLLLRKTNDKTYVFGWAKGNVEIEESVKLPDGKFIFKDKEVFDNWLLSQHDLLNSLLNNLLFLKYWLPDNKMISLKDPLNKAQAYIFSIKTPRKNFSLASVIGEDKFFPDLTSNDKELYFMNLPVLHYTTAGDGIRTVYYCHINNSEKLKILVKKIKLLWADQTQKKLFTKALKTKRYNLLDYQFPKNETFLEDLKSCLSENSQQYDLSNIPEKHIPALLENIKNFLLSNNINSLKKLSSADKILKAEIADRFYNAKTTAFFREWREMKFLNPWLEEKDEELQQRPLKIKVFGCSTGQEVLSYAIDLLEHGVSNFKILASDIDPKVLAEAETMTYLKEKFLTIPEDRKRNLIENYFELIHNDAYRIKFLNFFRERIHFMIQDITEPLPVNEIPEDFAPPYDLISVKNIFLYLDKESVNKSVEIIKDIAADKSILIIRDKKNKASNFVLHKKNDPFIPLTDYMLYKMPDTSETTVMNSYNLFSESPSPQLQNFFYKYADINHFRDLKEKIAENFLNTSTFNFFINEMLFDFSYNKSDYNTAKKIFRKTAQAEPVKTYTLLSNQALNINPSKLDIDKELKKTSSLIQMLADPLYGKDNLKLKLMEKINDFLISYNNIYLANIVLHSMVARDLGRFNKVKPTENGWWISEAVKLFYPLLEVNSFDQQEKAVIVETLSRLLTLKIQFFPKYSKLNEITDNQLLLEKILETNNNLLSPYGKICSAKILCLFAKKKASLGEKRKLYHLALERSRMDEETLDLLTDRWLGEYYAVQALANIEMGHSSQKAMYHKDQEAYYKQALEYLEDGLAVKTVYANKEIRQIKNIKKILKTDSNY